MDNHPNPETLQELRSAVARHGVAIPLPSPVLGHCDDCSSYGATFRLGRVEVCLADWLRRQRVRARLADPGVTVR